MKKTLICSYVLLGLFAVYNSASAIADDPPTKPSPPTAPSKPTPAPKGESPNSAQMSAREKAFADLLTGAVMEGTWRMTHFNTPQEETKLGEPRSDRYEIVSAIKSGGEHWVITARIVYADRDVNLPVPVRVVWADDTPMITLSELAMPMLGTYSARVMFHHGFYSGVWYGPTYGGLMSGQIARKKTTAKTTE